MILFDDSDIQEWIKKEFKEPIIYNTYKQLKIGAGRADFMEKIMKIFTVMLTNNIYWKNDNETFS